MKIRIFVALLACCLLLCGCGTEETSVTPEPSAPEATGTPTTPNEPIVDDNGVPSLTVTEDPELTIPGFIWGEEGGFELPIDDFDPDGEHVAVPIGTVPPTTSEDISNEDDVPPTTTEPTPPPETYFSGDILPEDVWEDE